MTFTINHNIGNLTDRIDKIVVKNNELIIYYSDIKDSKNPHISVSHYGNEVVITYSPPNKN